MMKKILTFVCLLPAVLLTGCATMISGTSQVVNVQAISSKTHEVIHGAKCELTDSNGVVYPVSTNPGSVSIPRVYGGLSVYCHSTGYYQKSIGTGSSFNAWVLADVIFWPGAVVDAATGAAKKYPSHITVLMSTHPVKHPKTKVVAK